MRCTCEAAVREELESLAAWCALAAKRSYSEEMLSESKSPVWVAFSELEEEIRIRLRAKRIQEITAAKA